MERCTAPGRGQSSPSAGNTLLTCTGKPSRWKAQLYKNQKLLPRQGVFERTRRLPSVMRREKKTARRGVNAAQRLSVAISHFRARPCCEELLFSQGHHADFNSAGCNKTAHLCKCCILFSSCFWPFLN